MPTNQDTFNAFGFEASILSALSDLGYERATPIQIQAIPVLLSGDDLLAQAQTGTGKTAAFALPIISRLDYDLREPQALVLVPTRELAIQVAEAFQSYAKHIKKLIIAPIYGGQSFRVQLRLLDRGAQVIVGTPGRLMDHLRRKSLSTKQVKMVVLDEADEMLNMGFVDDVEWILEKIPKPHQTALFSATIPQAILRITNRYLQSAKRIHIQSTPKNEAKIAQYYVVVSREQKLAALTRLLESESTDGVLIFARTKTETSELSEKLRARGFSSAALNGDMSQSAREKVVSRFKKGLLDLLVATDVAARGIDVDRISHVINYDIPHDAEVYVHRIGRTGRAGRSGKTILLVTPREQRLFREIERYTKQPIAHFPLPKDHEVREKRAEQWLEKITEVLKTRDIKECEKLIDTWMHEKNHSAKSIAAAALFLNHQGASAPDEIDISSEFETERRQQHHKPRKHFSRHGRGGGDRNQHHRRRR